MKSAARSAGDRRSARRRGGLAADASAGLDDWLGPPDRLPRDSQMGKIGGGNHFVEIQRVERIIDRETAHAWGLRRGAVTVMVHTGSVSLGHASGMRARDAVREAHPVATPHPTNGIFILPHGPRSAGGITPERISGR